MIYSLGDRRIETAGDDYFVAPSADVIGSVRLGRWASVWFNAVLRGDNDWIELGEGTNVQDGSVLHAPPGIPTDVGPGATIAHCCVIHGVHIGQEAVIANHATVLDGAVIGRRSLVGAHALVVGGTKIPDEVFVTGAPAKVRGQIGRASCRERVCNDV